MNKQGSKANPSGGIEWTHFFGPGTGFTANPVRGCLHDCKWRVEGAIVECYAKAFRERLDGPGSFEQLSFHPEVLEAIKNHLTPAGIFIDSMSDLFGVRVKDEWIQQVIYTMNRCPRHVFFTLTKNPAGLRDWLFPANAIVGISAPPTFMYGKELSPQQQITWLEKGLEALAAASARRRWISIEPLSFDIAPILQKHRRALDWAVIGAGSNGARTFQPDAVHFKRCLEALDGIPVFFKGNLDLKFVMSGHGRWREEFPKLN